MLERYTLLFLFVILQACQQSSIKQYVQDSIKPIATISPDSTDFSDLQVIGNAIGEARVVMLGEQDHGDAPTFLAKTRLIKYLHEQKGFNVLAFESDFFALNEGWSRLAKQEDSIRKFVKRNIFSLWTKCVQCEALFDAYIPRTFQTRAPLQVSGFDNQNNGNYSMLGLRSFVDAYLRRYNIAFTRSHVYTDFFLPALDSLYTKKSPIIGRHLAAVADTILNQLKSLAPDVYGKLVIQSIKAYGEQGQHFTSSFKAANEVRDQQMARNLEWLVRHKYKGEKIIVWAANYHILKNAKESFADEKMKVGTMGDYFTNDTSRARQTYILGFTSKRGTAGRIRTEPYVVEPPKENSFESWIPTSLAYGFIDFKAFNQQGEAPRSFYMKGVYGYYSGIWTNMFDGVFYIRDMYPYQERN
ncbi:MAG TPA: erythromycin esterase family protein [Flavisolibacter sp.]|nr:erythromycin esterase family protein [Flavisolibacter sp.]